MGCDIHPHFEVRRNGRWEAHSVQTKYAAGGSGDGTDHIDWNSFSGDALFVGRNYDLFAMLADVRNGAGFAGCDTGDGFVPVADPKGFPADASPETLRAYTLTVDDERAEEDGFYSREDAEAWSTPRGDWLPSSEWMDEAETVVSVPDWHSASWLTLAELDAYDWDRTTRHRGWVDPWNFEVWRAKGKPGGWCGEVGGRSTRHVSNQMMARLIDGGEIQWAGPEPAPEGRRERPYTTGLQRDLRGQELEPGSTLETVRDRGDQFYTLVEWEEPYRESAKKFVDETLPALRKLGRPEDVRIVFWFDN
jgi:hypothetical protein